MPSGKRSLTALGQRIRTRWRHCKADLDPYQNKARQHRTCWDFFFDSYQRFTGKRLMAFSP